MIKSDEIFPNSVGGRIKAAREKAGLTQAELASKLNYNSPTAISLIEADERNIKVDTLQKIANILHQDFHYLTTGEQNVPSVKTALRADKNFNDKDVMQIESYIDYLMSQKEKNGR